MSTFPTTPVPKGITIKSLQPTFRSISHALNVQSRTRSAQRWGFVLEYPSLSWSELKALWGFLISLEGGAVSFDFSLPSHYATGSWSGTPTVDGAAQTGTSVTTTGWTPSTEVVKAGDFVQFASDAKVYLATSDLTADGAGDGTLSIQPALISSPADTSAIVTHTSVAPLIWTCTRTDDLLNIDRALGARYEPFSIEIAEVV